MSKCIRCYVSGRVQGVFYRASTEAVALKLGLSGHARNLPDQRVEVLACGEEKQLQKLNEWLLKGPQYADVTSVDCENIALDPVPSKFSTS